MVRCLPPAAAYMQFLQGPDVIHDVDAVNFCNLHSRLRDLKPSVIVNCSGIIKQRPEARARIPSLAINSLLPHKLAEFASEWGGRVIHFSTDCVFSGKKGSYTEDDPSDADDLYGKSKYLGEVAVPNALTLRTSIIGRELSRPPRALLDWFLSQNHGKVQGFRRAIYAGVTTNHLAEVTADVIANRPHITGLYQVASRPISKYDLLVLLREVYEADIQIEPVEGEICDRSMLPDKFLRATGYVCPEWPVLVRQLAEDKTPYPQHGE